MIIILFWWVLFSYVISGLGAGVLLTLDLLPGKISRHFDFYRTFWLGFVALLCILQFISLLYPSNGTLFLVLFVLSSLSLVLKKIMDGHFWSPTGFRQYVPVRKYLIAAPGVLIAGYLVFSASQFVDQWDAYGTYFNTVRWANLYPAVPGIVNLDPKLAFNSSFFLFAALNEFWLAAGGSAHTALSFIILIAALQFLVYLGSKDAGLFERAFLAIGTIFIIKHLVLCELTASLSTDQAMMTVCMVFALELVRKKRFFVLMTAGLAAAMASVKMTGISSVLLVAGMICLHYIWVSVRKTPLLAVRGVEVAASVLIIVLLASGYMARNIVMSGWLFYPMPVELFNLDLSWSVPANEVKNMADIVKGDARVFQDYRLGLSLTHAEVFVRWLGKWTVFKEVGLFLMSAAFLVLTALMKNMRNAALAEKERYFPLLAYSVLAIFLWFTSAPTMRFGFPYFWLLCTVAFYPFIAATLQMGKSISGTATAAVLLILLAVPLTAYEMDLLPTAKRLEINPLWSATPATLTSLPTAPVPPLMSVAVTDEEPPLTVYRPIYNVKEHALLGTCGNSPIPCLEAGRLNVVRNIGLRQRVPGDISKGFYRIKVVK